MKTKTKTFLSILILTSNLIQLTACSNPVNPDIIDNPVNPINPKEKIFTIYSAPKEESLSKLYKVTVENKNLPVYKFKVAPAEPESRWRAMDNKETPGSLYEEAAFAYFDIKDQVEVTVSTNEAIHSVKILPSSSGIVANFKDKSLSFKIDKPMNLTIEVNGKWVSALHLFANPIEENVPDPNDPNVIYFGPGIHQVSNMMIGDNKTVYIAGGAIVYGIATEQAEAIFDVRGKNVTIRGRGIIDSSLCPLYSRFSIAVAGSDIDIEGVIMRDASHWTIPIRWGSNGVHVDNIKILGYRPNTDGIDILNSSNVLIENCFIRTLDDNIVVKTLKNEGKVGNITVQKCVLWNEVAHALSVGAEIREDVSNVLFEDCDVIHDKGREWTLRVYHTDAARVSNVRFKNIRIEETQRLISLWINKAYWSADTERGHIIGVEFRNISAKGDNLKIELLGYDQDHLIEDVTFKNVTFNNNAITKGDVVTNNFVKNVIVNSN
ncbi:MAG: glycosyl hydrolase family 28 protein [Dysgonamonadaceae bacterium]